MPKIFGSTSPFRWWNFPTAGSNPFFLFLKSLLFFLSIFFNLCCFNPSFFPASFGLVGGAGSSAQEGELQKLVFDDPSTSQLEDYWLHPCDCLNPATWGTGPFDSGQWGLPEDFCRMGWDGHFRIAGYRVRDGDHPFVDVFSMIFHDQLKPSSYWGTPTTSGKPHWTGDRTSSWCQHLWRNPCRKQRREELPWLGLR